jgi:hypothetical protein
MSRAATAAVGAAARDQHFDHAPSARVPARSAFAGFRFPPEVIVLAVRWYLRFGLSYRDVEELLAERGVDVDHVTVHRWVQRFSPLLADAARFGRHRVGDRWFVDETYVRGVCCIERSQVILTGNLTGECPSGCLAAG